MAVPTRESRGLSVAEKVADVQNMVPRARQLAVDWQAKLATPPGTAIHDILFGLYAPFAAAVGTGFWHTIQEARTFGVFDQEYLGEIACFIEFAPIQVVLAQNGLNIGQNNLNVGDPIQFRSFGTLPAPLVTGTVYSVESKPTATSIRVSDGTLVTLTDQGNGLHQVRFAVVPELVALETALEGVIDAIAAEVPTSNPTGGILSLRFDKSLQTGNNGLEARLLTPAETTGIQAALAAVENAIEPPQ